MITDELENDLRRAFVKAGAGIELPDAARARLCGRNYHPRRVHRATTGAIGAVALAAATGVAVPLAVGGGTPAVAAGAKISLDSYTFTMPPGYHAVHGRSACVLAIGAHVPSNPSRKAQVPNFRQPKVPAQMRAAASADGGCVGLLLLPAFRPAPGSPDPYAFAGAQPVRVGEFHALLYKFRSYVVGPDGRMIPERPGNFELFVELPVAGGKVRILAIGSDKLTRRELIKVASSGLPSSS